MKLINQSFEILEQKNFTIEGIKRFIERCGRVCYKSEDKITDTSYEKFVDMLEKRDHARPLEFGTVHLKMSVSDLHELRDTLCINKMWNSQWIKYVYNGDLAYITTNYRYFLDIVKILPFVKDCIDSSNTKLKNKYYKRYTVHFITNRVTMDSFRTHITLSHLGESTRYCNYSKGKFNNQVTFVIPHWCDLQEGEYNAKTYYNNTYYNPYCKKDTFMRACFNAEEDYLELINKGAIAQEARDILPLGIKSELISCGFEDAWNNFFYRRCDNAAHPMARKLACGLKEEFIKRGYLDESKKRINK